MGTSDPSTGTGPGTPLVPSFLDEPDSGPLPGGEDQSPLGDGVDENGSQDKPHQMTRTGNSR